MGTTTHGHSKINGRASRTYRAWDSMKRRCLKPDDPSFPRWGGRGITVCEPWLRFENFLADMGTCPVGLSLERKDNDGNYDPQNCKWATAREQSRNTCRTVRLMINGVTRSVSEWAEISGVCRATIYTRLKNGWGAQSAVFQKTELGRKHARPSNCNRLVAERDALRDALTTARKEGLYCELPLWVINKIDDALALASKEQK